MSHIVPMGKVSWMIVQGTIFVVPLYWFFDDPSVRTDPRMLLGLIALCWLLAALLTHGLTRLWDWCLFGPLKLALAQVGQTQSKSSSPPPARRRIRKLP